MICCDGELQNPLSGLLSGHVICAVHESAHGTSRTLQDVRLWSVKWAKADIDPVSRRARQQWQRSLRAGAEARREIALSCPLSGKPDIAADMAVKPLLTRLGHQPPKGVYRARTPHLGDGTRRQEPHPFRTIQVRL
jgi:hypothetical protein